MIINMKIKDILINEFEVTGDVEKSISGITYDSRKVRNGDVFAAIKGENFDGHDFIEDAINKGAVAVIYEIKATGDFIKKYPDTVWIEVKDSRDALAAISNKFYGRPSEKAFVIGITGTNGKTTTSYLMKSILEKWGKDVGLIGTITYLIKDMAYDAPHTTPEAPDFQALLREMVNNGCSHVVSEVSSHSLLQKRVDYTKFRVAVFTNLTRDHLDFHRTMEDYFMAKRRLFTELLTEDGTAVINLDDPYGKRLVNDLKGQKILTYAINNQNADVIAHDIKTTFKGTSFKFKIQNSKFKILENEDYGMMSPLVGITNVYNILSSICAALSMDIPIKIIKEGIAMTGLVKGRFEKVDIGQDFLAVVDYAHTEDALERLLLTARQLLEAYRFAEKTEKMMKAKRREYAMPEKLEGNQKMGKIITVFGCGGNRDRGKRSRMGEIAARLSDFVIITSDNPRNESPRAIIRDIEKGMVGDNYIIIPDRGVAISMAVELASSGDIVLVAGKGHEDYQEIQGKRYDFSDRVVLENAIRRTISRPSFGGGTNYKGTENIGYTGRC